MYHGQMSDFSNLKRARHPMAPFVEKALQDAQLMDAYRARPAYQQNDYLGWINRAKRQTTKDKRLVQMLSELKNGHLYMKMKWRSPNVG